MEISLKDWKYYWTLYLIAFFLVIGGLMQLKKPAVAAVYSFLLTVSLTAASAFHDQEKRISALEKHLNSCK